MEDLVKLVEDLLSEGMTVQDVMDKMQKDVFVGGWYLATCLGELFYAHLDKKVDRGYTGKVWCAVESEDNLYICEGVEGAFDTIIRPLNTEELSTLLNKAIYK